MTDVAFSQDSALLQFSQVAALQSADRCNVKTLMGCVKTAGERRGPLTGIGVCTWGDIEEGPGEKKSLQQLFLGLFTGFYPSPDPKPKEIIGVFPERLVMPRQGKEPDGLTVWVMRSFIPFYEELRAKYKYPDKGLFLNKHKKCLLPVWGILASIGFILFLLWHGFLFLWHKVFPTLKESSSDLEKKRENRLELAKVDSKSSATSIMKTFTEYSSLWIVRVTSIMTTVVACLLPTVAITVLARVHTMSLILGLIALFTAIFAVGLVLLSSTSSRVEIFTATAA
jgi:hypothetical protein